VACVLHSDEDEKGKQEEDDEDDEDEQEPQHDGSDNEDDRSTRFVVRCAQTAAMLTVWIALFVFAGQKGKSAVPQDILGAFAVANDAAFAANAFAADVGTSAAQSVCSQCSCALCIGTARLTCGCIRVCLRVLSCPPRTPRR